MHDVFHSSLLRIHVPNDDRLFPGRMDTQLEGSGDDGEWAVDRILSHHGSSTYASFEILWKSGDATWLPYYQITHLQALTDYLELLKVEKIVKLPKGSGRPPQDNPQVYVGHIMATVPSDPESSFRVFPAFFLFLLSALLTLNAMLSAVCYPILSFFQPSFISLTVDFEFDYTMAPFRSVDHPRFSRISSTHYLVKKESDGYFDATIHVGQVADYLHFDERLRIQRDLTDFQSVPLGYLDFAELLECQSFSQ